MISNWGILAGPKVMDYLTAVKLAILQILWAKENAWCTYRLKRDDLNNSSLKKTCKNEIQGFFSVSIYISWILDNIISIYQTNHKISIEWVMIHTILIIKGKYLQWVTTE